MPYCICASACGACTRNLGDEILLRHLRWRHPEPGHFPAEQRISREDKESRGTEYEKEMVLDCTAGNYRDPAIRVRRRRSGDASMELAAAAAFRLAHADLLASAGIVGSLPDSVRPSRGTSWTRSRSSLERSLQKDDARGTGKIPASDERRLRLRPVRKRERRAVTLVRRDMWGQPPSAVRSSEARHAALTVEWPARSFPASTAENRRPIDPKVMPLTGRASEELNRFNEAIYVYMNEYDTTNDIHMTLNR